MFPNNSAHVYSGITLKVIKIGNNRYGRAGRLSCSACRKRNSKVTFPSFRSNVSSAYLQASICLVSSAKYVASMSLALRFRGQNAYIQSVIFGKSILLLTLPSTRQIRGFCNMLSLITFRPMRQHLSSRRSLLFTGPESHILRSDMLASRLLLDFFLRMAPKRSQPLTSTEPLGHSVASLTILLTSTTGMSLQRYY